MEVREIEEVPAHTHRENKGSGVQHESGNAKEVMEGVTVDWMILGLFFSGIGGFGCLGVSVDLEILGASVDLRLGVFQWIVLFRVS